MPTTVCAWPCSQTENASQGTSPSRAREAVAPATESPANNRSLTVAARTERSASRPRADDGRGGLVLGVGDREEDARDSFVRREAGGLAGEGHDRLAELVG